MSKRSLDDSAPSATGKQPKTEKVRWIVNLCKSTFREVGQLSLTDLWRKKKNTPDSALSIPITGPSASDSPPSDTSGDTTQTLDTSSPREELAADEYEKDELVDELENDGDRELDDHQQDALLREIMNIKDLSFEIRDIPLASVPADTAILMRPIFISAIDYLVANAKLSRLWRHLLTSTRHVDTIVMMLVSGVSPGLVTVFQSPKGSPFPTVEELLSVLRPVHRVKKYGLYLKVAVPRDRNSDLPLLAYVGSATGWHGLHGRMLSHFSSMRSGRCRDLFWEYWSPHDEDYDVIILELWSLPLAIHSATYSQRMLAGLATLAAESTLMLLLTAHARLYPDFEYFTSGPTPSNKAEPLSAFIRKDVFMKVVYPCGTCDRAFTTQEGLDRHLQHLHEHGFCKIRQPHTTLLDVYKCENCGREFYGSNRHWNYERHLQSQSYLAGTCKMPSDKIQSCDKCDASWSTSDRVERLRNHMASLAYANGTCGSIPQANSVPPTLYCPKCNHPFVGHYRQNMLEQHKRSQGYAAGTCGNNFKNVAPLPTFNCDICGKPFEGPGGKERFRRHKDTKAYKEGKCHLRKAAAQWSSSTPTSSSSASVFPAASSSAAGSSSGSSAGGFPFASSSAAPGSSSGSSASLFPFASSSTAAGSSSSRSSASLFPFASSSTAAGSSSSRSSASLFPFASSSTAAGSSSGSASLFPAASSFGGGASVAASSSSGSSAMPVAALPLASSSSTLVPTPSSGSAKWKRKPTVRKAASSISASLKGKVSKMGVALVVTCEKCGDSWTGKDRTRRLQNHKASQKYKENRCHIKVPDPLSCDKCDRSWTGIKRGDSLSAHKKTLAYKEDRCHL